MENDTQISLAPAAGAGIGKAMFVELLKDPEFPTSLATAARDCLNATTTPRWDKNADNGTGGWTTGPDFRVRMQTLFGLLAQAEGMPIQRIIRENIGAGRDIDPGRQLLDNPELLESVERQIAGVRRKLEWRTAGQQAHKRPVKTAAPN